MKFGIPTVSADKPYTHRVFWSYFPDWVLTIFLWVSAKRRRDARTTSEDWTPGWIGERWAGDMARLSAASAADGGDCRSVAMRSG